MKKIISRIINIVLGGVAVVAVGLLLAVKHGDGGGFLDLSNFARMVYAGAAILFSSLAVLAWKTDSKTNIKT